VPGPTIQPALSNFFKFEIDGRQIGLYHSVQGIKWSCDTVTMDTQNKTGTGMQRVVPGRYNRPGELTFKTYAIDDALWKWFDKALAAGAAGMANGSVKFLDPNGRPLANYEFTNGWPSKLSWSSLEAGSSSALEVEVTVQVETLQLKP
jgi:phage tail-like protein